MTTPVTIGSSRQLWFARLTDSTPQWSFLEDPVGTTKRAAQFGRSIRLGDPMNLGPNSNWHQLTWEGGEGQDIWKDPEMYQWGDADVLTYSGKTKMWPGLQSWAKWEHMGRARRVVLQQGSRSDGDLVQLQTDLHGSVMYAGEGDLDHFEKRAPYYMLYQIHPNYTPGDTRAVQYLGANTEPFRFIVPMNSDDGISNIQMIATATRLYTMVESAQVFVQDTGAPATTTANWQFMHDSAKDFGQGLYYLHGNRLMKRVGKPPYGTIGTHTVVKWLRSAVWCRGMEVWNNRLYFGAMYPNGKAAVFVSDGSTSTKAFDLPQQAKIAKLKAVAGALYILTSQGGDLHGGTAPSSIGSPMVQQVWRYDGRGLKKLWQQGLFNDGFRTWPSDLSDWNGMVVWGRQGVPDAQSKANLVFYDPVRDSIVRGPGLDLDAANVGSDYGRGLWISSIATWHNTLAVFFKDDTEYAHNLKRPGMLATVRPDTYVKNDLRYHTVDGVGDVNQFKASAGSLPSNLLVSSEYHGTDDVATEQKTWLSVRVRVRLTGSNSKIDVYILHPKGDATAKLSDATSIGTVNWAAVGSQTGWVDVVLPCKLAGAYLKSQKIQVFFKLSNTDGTTYDSQHVPWLDDASVQWMVSPKKRRQWQVRIPVTTNQLCLDGTANALATSNALAQQLEDIYFEGNIVKFWEPATSSATPASNAYVECKIEDFQRQQARLASDESEAIGYVTMTLVENVLS